MQLYKQFPKNQNKENADLMQHILPQTILKSPYHAPLQARKYVLVVC